MWGCVCLYVRACVPACMRACVCVRVCVCLGEGGGFKLDLKFCDWLSAAVLAKGREERGGAATSSCQPISIYSCIISNYLCTERKGGRETERKGGGRERREHREGERERAH